MASKYPEHDKLTAVQEQSQVIGEFLDWLLNAKRVHSERFKHDALEMESPVMLAIWRPQLYGDPLLVPYLFRGIQNLLADYFEVDLDKIEQEKHAMLDEIRGARRKEEAKR